MVDRTYLSLTVVWNECQNSYKPEARFVETIADFLLSKSEWLEKASGQKEVLDIIKERVEKKLAEKKKVEKKTAPEMKVKEEIKSKAIPVKTQKVKREEPGSREVIDLTNLEPDNSNDEGDKDEEKEDGMIPVNNGGQTERYVWTQTLSELDILIEVPKLPSKSFFVEIKSSHLKMGVKGKKLVIDDDLEKEVDPDESLWSMSEEAGVAGKLMTISLVKKKKMEWWSRVCMGDPKINTRKIEPENSNLGDLDGDTRKTVEKMMFDQRQKAQGLPTSEEIQNKDKLKSFMAAHPEMDFSKCNFGGGGGFNMK